MSNGSPLNLGEDTQLLIVDDLDDVPGQPASGRFIPSSATGFVASGSVFVSGSISPPPLIGLDRPGPPNVAILPYPTCSRYCRYVTFYHGDQGCQIFLGT
jgi:hypothetical protein